MYAFLFLLPIVCWADDRDTFKSRRFIYQPSETSPCNFTCQSEKDLDLIAQLTFNFNASHHCQPRSSLLTDQQIDQLFGYVALIAGNWSDTFTVPSRPRHRLVTIKKALFIGIAALLSIVSLVVLLNFCRFRKLTMKKTLVVQQKRRR